MIGIVSYETEIIATLSRPLVQPSMHVLCSADLEEHSFLRITRLGR